MTIPAKRFNFLDQETNVAVSDFFDPATSEIFNSPNLELKEIDTDLEEFLDLSFSADSITLPPVQNDQSSIVRKAKDAFSSVRDISKMSPKDIDNAIVGMFPGNPKAAGAFKQLSGKCRTGPFGRFNSGKPYDAAIDCNGRSRRGRNGGCSPSGIGNILDTLSGGEYGSKFRDLNQMLQNLVALATSGYNANLCGVFQALTKDMDIPGMVKSRGASMLLGSLGATQNLRGVFDLSGQVASQSLNPIREIPNGISGVLNNFKTPFDIRERDFDVTNITVNESMGAFKGGWNTSEFDGVTSVAEVQKYTSDYDRVMRGEAMSQTVDEDFLDVIPSNDTNLMRAGFMGTKSPFAGASLFG